MLPKFTIKQSLLAMIVFAFMAFCLASAWRGSVIGFGIATGVIIFLVVIPLTFSLVYWIGLGLAHVVKLQPPGSRRTKS